MKSFSSGNATDSAQKFNGSDKKGTDEILGTKFTAEEINMRRPFALSIACLLISAGIALAQDSPSGVGTWKMDLSQSDFGSEPAPKAVTLIIINDAPTLVSWRVRYVDDKGQVTTYSWSGPPDGSMHPVMQNGKAVSKQSAKKEPHGVLLRHGEDPDGSSFDAISSISEDGKTITDDITLKSKDGKETKQKFISHRTGTGPIGMQMKTHQEAATGKG